MPDSVNNSVNNTKWDLVIFDCDGVLVDSEPLSALAYHNVYARHNMPIPDGTVAKGVGMKTADIVRLIGDLTGHYLPDAAQNDLWPETHRVFAESLEPCIGIAGVLERLKMPHCVASSSTPERIAFSLEKTGLIRAFTNGSEPALYSSTMVKRGKPAPDLFLFAAEKFGVDPARCVVFEDSPYGVEGAVAAGMTAIGYTGGGHTYEGHEQKLLEKGAKAVYSDWKQIENDIL